MSSEVESRTVSRRRMVSLLGLAAALGFAVSPTGAEATRPPAPPAPAACSGVKSGAESASNDVTSAAEARLQQNSLRKPSLHKPSLHKPSLRKNSS